ncbi:MAG: signal peptidase I [Enterococcus sp.]|uniref:signal peptidase I n=1 Tax=Enterococcus sp. TaxID=35783 RepID=UPI002648C50D|nr:signal peptidase I [Enterococcus sp.]MDN6003126.1 signal peptidase I [Enterococcus sp.]MDN6518086.1 signal peptidase I [Enterococcus sp.]MDN6561348.1 signal peptidase I [Enterococcus sp.]MDN6777740.1 signal peptidase I [Enterococcus sp.]
MSSEKKQKRLTKKSIIRRGVIISFLFGIVFFLFCWIHENYLIHPVAGTSMEVTLKDGDHVFLNKRSPIDRYSIIGFSVSGEEGMFVKRILGMPGDAILIQGNQLTLSVGDSTFKTTYSFELDSQVAKEMHGLKEIPSQSYFVMGDHVSVSKDSRFFGFVEGTEIEGKVQYEISSLTDIHPIN